MKLDYLRNTLGRTRVVTLATATPVANGLQEMYVMQRYLRPDVLKDAGIDSADDWARQFTQEVRAPEVGPAGDLRMKTRIGKFRNTPELLRMFHIAGDVKSARDLNLPVPLLTPLPDGRRAPRVVLVPKNDGTKQFQEQLKARAEAIRARIVDPRDDNMLSLSNDARLAALDLRLLDSAWEYDVNTPSKADLVVREVMRVHRAHADTEYRDVFGRTHATRGGLQIVFCDRGTPGDKFNMYDELKAGLIGAGMPPRAIRYIHDANTDLEKAALFKACRDGDVSVIIGSTEKMGTGTNIQTRVTALHHIDCPWRPADIVQREGRGIRQGNQNAEIEILRYVQQGSFDAYMWQTVTRKAAAFEQIMAGTSEARDYELDPSEDVQNMVEAATGGIDDPRVMERITLGNTIKRLKSLERGFHREKAVTQARLRDVISIRDGLSGQLPHLDAIRAERRDTAGDGFTGYCTNGTASRAFATNERTRFAAQVQAAVEQFHTAWYQPSTIPTPTRIIATVGGVSFTAKSYRHATTNKPMVRFDLTRLDPYGYARSDAELGTEMSVTFELDELRGALPSAIAQRFEHRVNNLDEHDRAVRAKISSLVDEEKLIRQTVDQPWPRMAELADTEAKLAALVDAMQSDVAPAPTEMITPQAMGPIPAVIGPTASVRAHIWSPP
ncbi:helicase-related protein [Agromyces sp. Marseille-P2726]|uniref:helicase-related protein n=1 Tax=Agromyces sp. Marseille-P2726 TaxID=2709132 RepID=UPI001C2D5CDF|nr:helicase-related protein [Agromyces sp. Marseille-P2726]